VDFDIVVDPLGASPITNCNNPEPWITALRREKDDLTFREHFQILFHMLGNI
jgi:hypothetical protein